MQYILLWNGLLDFQSQSHGIYPITFEMSLFLECSLFIIITRGCLEKAWYVDH